MNNYTRYQKFIEDYLSELWKNDDTTLAEAIRYSLMSGGKRVRPVITLAFSEVCGGKAEDALPAACAIELIHTYSLIHDDLPCMDNDDFRRGKPTNHKVYGETIALLAGDALLSRAFCIADHKTVDVIANAAYDMVRGQAMEFDGHADTQAVNELKTGALFRAAARTGCIMSGADAEKQEAAVVYADELGLAFQYRDDMLDMTDASADGIDRRLEVRRHTTAAKDALRVFDNNMFLTELADSLSEREN